MIDWNVLYVIIQKCKMAVFMKYLTKIMGLLSGNCNILMYCKYCNIKF